MVSGEDRVEVMPLVAESRGRVEKVTMRVRGQRTKRLGFSSFPLPPDIKLHVPLVLGNC